MYNSLLLPWSPPTLASRAEHLYRTTGHVRTRGTIFLLPPPTTTLTAAYNTPPRLRTKMSSGAVALCKHFERGGASSEHGRAHPYWTLPRGSNEAKTEIAREVLERLWGEVVWRNVMLLHAGVAVYEVRNERGFGMRWTLELEGERESEDEEGVKELENGVRDEQEQRPEDDTENGNVVVKEQQDEEAGNKNWKIVKTTFRGFVEPIEGMDHELDNG